MLSQQYQIFRKDYDRHKHCNGYAIAVRSKIRKPPKVKCLSHGARWKT